MAKIYLELRSGLGNQLFQFAFGYTLSSQFGKELVLCPAYFGPRWKYWLKKALGREARAFRLPLIVPNEYAVVTQKYLRNLQKDNSSAEIIDELKSDISSILTTCSQNKDVYIKGYWQDPDLFSKYNSQLSGVLAPMFKVSEKYGTTLSSLNDKMVALHVRRGDFLTNRAFGACTIDYYISAMQTMKEKIGDVTFVVFTNNRKWVEQNFPKTIRYTIYSNPLNENTDLEEMFLMSKFNSVIISNSTFSWWSAFLNSVPGKHVICPKKWFMKAALQEKSKNLILKNWTTLENELELSQ